MARNLGMDVSQVRAKAAALRASEGPLGQLASQLAQTREAARHPDRYGIEPGEKTIAPWSIESLASIRADLIAAQAAMSDLVARALGEADAQAAASVADRSVRLAVAKARKESAAQGLKTGEIDVPPMPPYPDILDPKMVQAWWASLSDEDKAWYIENQPQAIGGLEGIDYASRHKANRNFLDEEIDRLEDLKAKVDAAWPWERDAILDAAGVKDLDEKLKDAYAIKATLNGGGKDEVRQLVSFDLSTDDSVAVISIGDLDKADNVTFMIPGIDTRVEKSMEDQGDAAQALRDQQFSLGEENTAVVAWLGYETPDDIGQMREDKWAVNGAPSLVDDLEGLSAIRDWGPNDSRLDVVSLSYGSTLALNALTQTDVVGTLTVVGSAGYEGTVGDVSDIKLSSNNIYVSDASNDSLAEWARILSGRDDPQGLDGVTIFSSESDGKLTEVTEHGGLVEGDGRGYYDPGTNSLYNIGLITIGKQPH
jgi:hypothetical protein